MLLIKSFEEAENLFKTFNTIASKKGQEISKQKKSSYF